MDNTNLFTNGEHISLDIPKIFNYNMTNEKRGKAIIFNHYTEDEGGPCDVNNLETTLGLKYGFEVIVHNNLTYSQMYAALSKAAGDDYTHCDCLFLAVLTHGNVNSLRANDRSYKPDELWTPFTLCQSLVGKPKIFLLHACRGTDSDPGVPLTQKDSGNTHLLPRTADMLIIYSSFEGFVSYLTSNGSPFITILCDQLTKTARYEFDFCQLLTIVNNIVAYNCSVVKEGIKKQMPTYSNTLTKLLYFAPKRNI